MKVCIRNMISPQSKKRVRALIEAMNIRPVEIDMCEVKFQNILSDDEYQQLRINLLAEGFEIITDKNLVRIEKIKCIIADMIYNSDELPIINYSDFISTKISANYTYLSKLFSRAKGITIERFIILNKIEKAKQLLASTELTLSEIAWKLHYSSTAHLSAQFKKITGITPSSFKRLEFKQLILPENM